MILDTLDSTLKFEQAGSLFRQGRPQEALALLDELNQAHPNDRNILYPAALCLERLGRSPDALRLCDILITQHQDERALAVKARLTATAQATAHPPVIPEIRVDFDFDSPVARRAPPRPVSQDNSVYWWAGGLTIAGLAIILVAGALDVYAARGLSAISNAGPASFEDMPWGDLLRAFAGSLLISLLAAFPSGYVALRVTGYLQDDFVEDAKIVLLTVALCNLMLLTCIGIVFVPFYLKKKFEMTFGELAIAIVVYTVSHFVLGFVFSKSAAMLGGLLFSGA